MNTIKRIILFVIYFTWCLPQTLLGLIWFIICKIRKFKTYKFNSDKHKFIFTYWTTDPEYSPKGGVSLGMFIFGKDRESVKYHEYGHAIQSLILGWLYLIVIAIPSLIWLLIYKRTNKNYHWFYTESWADKLGQVKRN